MQCREVFKCRKFKCTDFEELTLKNEDFIYADPPYDVEFASHSKGGFDWEDRVRPVKWLAKHPGLAVLSNQATERFVELYGDYRFKIKYYNAPRRISCNGDKAPEKIVLAARGV